MTSDANNLNRRVLVIDDNQAIHQDFRKILQTKAWHEGFDQARAALFGDPPLSEALERFDLDCADQGQAALIMVQLARNEGRPYAVAFVDMRMPPGWDGLETIEHLWEADAELQVVICTAFSDHPWEEITKRIGQNDKLLILQKPFNSIEVLQLATALCRKWDLAHEVAGQLDELNRQVDKRTAELQGANEQLTQTNADLVRTVANLEVAQAEILRQNDALERLASRDPLTGCFNRRAFYMQFETAFAESREHDTQLCCLMVDIDHFKRINDQFGHAVGDQAIQAVAGCLSSGLRLVDTIGRYGGEEFCLMFPRTTLAEAADLAERLRIRVEIEAGVRVRTASSLAITVSCGISSTALGAKTPLDLIDQSDKALYAAKESGRNCVMVLDLIIAGANASDQFEPQVRRITPRVSSPQASR
ncbi:MAG TPA: diguanylate cyclase [Nitrospiraceae bacterium]|nr:diguanylate cyclase [Nitrospiraceae bacterium]